MRGESGLRDGGGGESGADAGTGVGEREAGGDKVDRGDELGSLRGKPSSRCSAPGKGFRAYRPAKSAATPSMLSKSKSR